MKMDHEVLVEELRDKAQELRDQLGEKVAESRAILEKAAGEQRARTAAEDATLNTLDKEMDVLEREIRQADRELQLAEPQKRGIHMPVGDGSPAAPAPSGSRWIDLKNGKEIRALLPGERVGDTLNFTREERALSLANYFRGIVTNNWTGAEAEKRAAMTIGTATGGGFLVPAPLSAQLVDLARSLSVVIRMGAQTIPMDSTTLALARVTADPTGAWYSDEVRASGLTESQGTFGRLTLNSHTLAILARASVELAEDAPNFGNVIERSIAAAMALEIDRAVLFGIPGGGWGGLRDWLVGDATNSINEHSMGTNGAQLTTFVPFITALQKILEGNYPGELAGLASVMSPRTWGTIEALVEATTNAPLRAPTSVEQLRKFVSTQISITETQGSSNVASTAFVGDFSQVLIGVRTDQTFEMTREGGDAFTRLHVLFRSYFRGDWTVLQHKWLTRIVGIIP